jgi:hypothetical protein
MTDLLEVTQSRPHPQTMGYRPSRITLYGVPFYHLTTDDVTVYFLPSPLTQNRSLVLVYGYCYQGHCYTLPEPMVVLVEAPGTQANGSCGWNSPYLSWEVDKLDATIQFQAFGDTFEELILKRNINAAKQPVAYSIAWQMAHRGGKLIE